MSTFLFDMFPALAAYLLLLVAVLGACMGSFMNCLAWRLTTRMSILRDRSHCPQCKAELTVLDLIPVVSWVALRGRCRHCSKRISPRYVIVEMVMMAVFVLLVLRYGFTVQALAYVALACILCGVTLVDFDTYTIPNGFIAAGTGLWAVSVWFIESPAAGFGIGSAFAGFGFWAVILDGACGALLLGGGTLVLSLVFDRVVGRQSLGGGDVKLLFVAGLFLGVAMGMFCLLLSCVIGLLLAFVLMYFGPSQPTASDRADCENQAVESNASGEHENIRTRAIPFGPAISVATVVTLFIGPACLTWYVGLLM